MGMWQQVASWPWAGHVLALAVADLCGISISPKTSQCSDSSQGAAEGKHCRSQHITNK